MVYLVEAHADDTWPLGFGVFNPKTIEERWANCDKLLIKHPNLKPMIDVIFCDNMDNDFNKATGAWPECYYFADAKGETLW